MLTKDFIEKLEKLGCETEMSYTRQLTVIYKGYDIFTIDTTSLFIIDTNYRKFLKMKDKVKEEIFNLAIEYIKTPVEDREEKKEISQKEELFLGDFVEGKEDL